MSVSGLRNTKSGKISPVEALCMMDEFKARPTVAASPVLHHFSSFLIRVSRIEARLRDQARNNMRGEDGPSGAMWSCGWPLLVVGD